MTSYGWIALVGWGPINLAQSCLEFLLRFILSFNLHQLIVLQSWTDDFLSWDPRDYGGLKTIVVPSNQIWIPELTLKNG